VFATGFYQVRSTKIEQAINASVLTYILLQLQDCRRIARRCLSSYLPLWLSQRGVVSQLRYLALCIGNDGC